jgi:hypothetical protein
MYHDILFINKHCLAIYICALYIPPPELRKYTGERGLWSWCFDKSVVFFETPVSSTNKTEIFLKVAVNTIKLKHG